jgi:hypothetical protein
MQKNEGITSAHAIILCVFTSIITLMVCYFALPHLSHRLNMGEAGGAAKVVSLDFERIMRAGLNKAMSNAVGVSEVQKDADKFQQDITAAYKAYAARGYLVINSKAIISGSTASDVTPEVIKSLGLQSFDREMSGPALTFPSEPSPGSK